MRNLAPFVLLCGFLLFGASQAVPQSTSGNQTFVLSGDVVNSATGEGIPRALVRTSGTVVRSAFTDNQGHFQIEGMPQCQVTVVAQKPGFFSEQEAGAAGAGWINVGPGSRGITVKLVPQSAIYGRVTDATGQPIERMPLHLTSRAVREGYRRLEPRGMTETDEDGHFRFAGLAPGTYYLAAGPREGELLLLPSSQKQKNGYPHTYFPGVPDLSSAGPIQLNSGRQFEADFSLTAVPVFQVSGMVAGHLPDQGVGFQVLTASGDEISVGTNFNMETGIFTLDNVPPGTYLLRALSQANLQPMRAEARINVTSNIEGLRLTLAPTITIPINVRMDARGGSGMLPAYLQRPPVNVHLVPADMTAAEAFSSYEGSRGGIRLRNVDFGTYTVDLRPQPPWYVQSASYGQTNVLYDDINVAAGQSYSLDIVLRNDSASVSGTVKSPDGVPARATVVIVPQPMTKLGARLAQGVTDTFSVAGLAPGEYLVFALDRAQGLELSNPDVVEQYASQAAHVTLTAAQQAQVQLDLIQVGKGN